LELFPHAHVYIYCCMEMASKRVLIRTLSSLPFWGVVMVNVCKKKKKTYQMRTIFGGINHYNDVIRQTTVYHCTMTVFF